jgi:hypothetical protein
MDVTKDLRTHQFRARLMALAIAGLIAVWGAVLYWVVTELQPFEELVKSAPINDSGERDAARKTIDEAKTRIESLDVKARFLSTLLARNDQIRSKIASAKPPPIKYFVTDTYSDVTSMSLYEFLHEINNYSDRLEQRNDAIRREVLNLHDFAEDIIGFLSRNDTALTGYITPAIDFGLNEEDRNSLQPNNNELRNDGAVSDTINIRNFLVFRHNFCLADTLLRFEEVERPPSFESNENPPPKWSEKIEGTCDRINSQPIESIWITDRSSDELGLNYEQAGKLAVEAIKRMVLASEYGDFTTRLLQSLDSAKGRYEAEQTNAESEINALQDQRSTLIERLRSNETVFWLAALRTSLITIVLIAVGTVLLRSMAAELAQSRRIGDVQTALFSLRSEGVDTKLLPDIIRAVMGQKYSGDAGDDGGSVTPLGEVVAAAKGLSGAASEMAAAAKKISR